MFLVVRPSRIDEFDLIWSLYEQFIKANVFGNDSVKALAKASWDESREQDRFKRAWDTAKLYIIEVDDKPIGWLSLETKGNEITIENIMTQNEWRGRGLVRKLFEEMLPKWRNDGKTVRVPVFQHNEQRKDIEAALVGLGFQETTKDGLTKMMVTK